MRNTIIGNHKKFVSSVGISRSDQFIIWVSSNKTIIFWDLKNLFRYTIIGKHEGFVNSVHNWRSDRFIASASDDTMIKLWDLQNKLGYIGFVMHQMPAKSVLSQEAKNLLYQG